MDIINKENQYGTTGLLLATFALFFDTIPWFGWLLLLLGFIISIIGLIKCSSSNAKLGLTVSLIAVIPLALQLWLKFK